MRLKFDICGLQNIEKYVLPILRETGKRRNLISVTKSEKDELTFEFSDVFSDSAKSFAKQFKKKDYASVDDAIKKAMNQEQALGIKKNGYGIVSVVETKKVWIVFWSKP